MKHTGRDSFPLSHTSPPFVMRSLCRTRRSWQEEEEDPQADRAGQAGAPGSGREAQAGLPHDGAADVVPVQAGRDGVPHPAMQEDLSVGRSQGKAS